MTLPFTINTTYAAGSQVKSDDLNEMQEAIAAEHNRPLHIAAAAFMVQEANEINLDVSGFWISLVTSGSKQAVFDLTRYLIPGDTIKEIVWGWINGGTSAGGGTAVMTLNRTPISTPTTETVIDTSSQDTVTGGGSTFRSVTETIGHVVLADNIYTLQVELNAIAGDDQAGFHMATVVLGV